MDNSEAVKGFYENEDEEGREGRETLEFFRVKKIVSRYLYDSAMEIADVGGATGAYSFWLAEMGHRVHLLDFIQKHIDAAKLKGREKGIGLASYTCSDARKLPYENESMDLVLMMGALYHLQSRDERLKCLTEARRILKAGGVLLCSVMNRYSILIATMKYKNFDSYSREYIENAIATGEHDGGIFYGHAPNEIVFELSSAGFKIINLIAVEGIANALGDNQIPDDEMEASRLLWSVELTESVPELIGVSRNIVAVGKKIVEKI